LKGNLLVASLDGTVRRIELDGSGSNVTLLAPLFSNAGDFPLDVVARSDDEEMPGTVWVADFSVGKIRVFEPLDYESECGLPCTGADDWNLDEDGDGYKNADELLNGTSPCSSADTPPDADHDLLSDLLDPDDDNDSLPDTLDPFAIDPLNGQGTLPPLDYSWFGGDPGTGILDLGFTGLMTDGETNYQKLYEPELTTAGGAAGVLTLDEVRLGAATGSYNKQFSGLQLGIAVSETTGPYYLQTRILAPYFDNKPPSGGQTQGFFAGTGDQDNYIRLVLAAGGPQGALEVGVEVAGVYQAEVYPAALLSSDHIDLRLSIDTMTRTIQPRASIDGAPFFDVGPSISLPTGSALEEAFFGPPSLAVGVMASAFAAYPFSATWDDLQVQLGGP